MLKLDENFINICRLCLIDRHSLREICGTKIPSMIKYCLDIKLFSQDKLPSQICIKCFRQVSNFYCFKRKTEKNEQILKKALRQMTDRKNIAKDLINIALEKSNINSLEISETVGTIKDSLFSGKMTIINTDLDTTHSQQHSLCFNYNDDFSTGPPPLVPLQPSSDSQIKTRTSENMHDILISQNTVTTSILLPPPLVPIRPINVESDIDVAEIKTSLPTLFCNVCMKEFESLPLLQEHRLKSSCKLSTHECNICKKSFKDQKKLIGHLKGHKITKEYLCNVCGKKYSSPSTFRIHLRSHTGERPFKCNVCGKGFVRWAGVKNHMITHEDVKPYKCETCRKQFKVISNLYRHQRLHTGNYTFRCSYCRKAFCQSDHLKLHIRTHHTNEKPYLCCECGKGFVSLQRLKRHELVHSGQKPYPCLLCRRAYSNSIDLKIHYSRIHNKTGNGDELMK